MCNNSGGVARLLSASMVLFHIVNNNVLTPATEIYSMPEQIESHSTLVTSSLTCVEITADDLGRRVVRRAAGRA